MFSREDLESLTIPQLAALCRRYGLRPTGNPAYKTSYITSLMVFPAIAIRQLQDRSGLRLPTISDMEAISNIVDKMNEPTDEQIALIRASFEGRVLDHPARYDQEKLVAIYNAKLRLEEALGLLAGL